MHLRGFFLTFALLAAAVTLFPPYLWGQDRIEEWIRTKVGDDTQRRETYPSYLPLKARAFLFADNGANFQTGWGWDYVNKKSIPLIETLRRSVSWEDIFLEYILALTIALIVGAVIPSTPKARLL